MVSLITTSTLHTALVLVQEGSLIIREMRQFCTCACRGFRTVINLCRYGIKGTGIICKGLALGSALKVLACFEVAFGVMMTFFCEFVDFSNPGGETSLPGLFAGHIGSSINQVLYFTVLAPRAEVNIKQTIELETQGVFGEMIIRAT
jgi:hypothetical protein